jgi:hypothetical protein
MSQSNCDGTHFIDFSGPISPRKQPYSVEQSLSPTPLFDLGNNSVPDGSLENPTLSNNTAPELTRHVLFFCYSGY